MSCQNPGQNNDTQATNQNTTQETLKPQTPIMGWFSWNNFHVNINEVDTPVCIVKWR
jgi:hypothetical protein